MLYILQLGILMVWFSYIIIKNKYSLHAIITTYFFFLMIIDVIEGILTYLFDFYEFSPHLLADHIKDNELGLVFCDGYLLPLTGIILCHYAMHIKNLWKLSLLFAIVNGILECIYLRLGYLSYNNWSTWISVAVYFFATRIFTSFSSQLLLYKPPIPYSFKIAFATYSITIYIGAYISGALISLYQWRPLIINDIGGDDRLTSLSISVLLALLLGIIIPKVRQKFKWLTYIVSALLVTSFSYYAHSKGWLIYHKWNNVLTALYWIVSFTVLMWYDHWESKFNRNLLFKEY